MIVQIMLSFQQKEKASEIVGILNRKKNPFFRPPDTVQPEPPQVKRSNSNPTTKQDGFRATVGMMKKKINQFFRPPDLEPEPVKRYSSNPTTKQDGLRATAQLSRSHTARFTQIVKIKDSSPQHELIQPRKKMKKPMFKLMSFFGRNKQPTTADCSNQGLQKRPDDKNNNNILNTKEADLEPMILIQNKASKKTSLLQPRSGRVQFARPEQEESEEKENIPDISHQTKPDKNATFKRRLPKHQLAARPDDPSKLREVSEQGRLIECDPTIRGPAVPPLESAKEQRDTRPEVIHEISCGVVEQGSSPGNGSTEKTLIIGKEPDDVIYEEEDIEFMVFEDVEEHIASRYQNIKLVATKEPGDLLAKAKSIPKQKQVPECEKCLKQFGRNPELNRHKKAIEKNGDCRSTGKYAVCNGDHEHEWDFQRFDTIEEARNYAKTKGEGFNIPFKNGSSWKAYCASKPHGCKSTWSIAENHSGEYLFRGCSAHLSRCAPHEKGKSQNFEEQKTFGSFDEALKHFYDQELDAVFTTCHSERDKQTGHYLHKEFTCHRYGKYEAKREKFLGKTKKNLPDCTAKLTIRK